MTYEILNDELSFYRSDPKEISIILESMIKILRVDRTPEGIQDALKVLFSAPSILVLKLLAKHKLGPALFILSEADKHYEFWSSDPQGKALYNIVEKYYFRSQKRYQIAKDTAKHIVGLFNKAGIQPLMIRGITIADLLYYDPAIRVFSDIDFVVSSEEFSQAYNILSMFPKHSKMKTCTTFTVDSYNEENLKLYIDLHGFYPTENRGIGEIILGYDYGNYVMQFYNRSKIVDSSIGSIRTIGENDLLQYLCIHFTKHLIKGGGYLLGLCDIAFLIHRYGEYLDWDEIIKLDSGNSLYPPLVFSSHWLGVNVPNDILEKIRKKTSRMFQKRVEIEKNSFGSATLGLNLPKYVSPLWASYSQKMISIFTPPFEYLENRGIIKPDTNRFISYLLWFKFLFDTYLLKKSELKY